MRCKKHKWVNDGIRMLKARITRGCQTANAEITEHCSECGKERRVTLINVSRPARLTG